MADRPTYDEMCRKYGYRTSDDDTLMSRGGKTQPMSVRSDSGVEAWTFVLMARLRGWVVSDPMHNGFQDVHNVTVWERGGLDHPDREGTFRHNPPKPSPRHTADEPCNCSNGIGCILTPVDKW